MIIEKEREKALEWFVQFANMDIDELMPGDRAKFLVEWREFFSSNEHYLRSKKEIPPGLEAFFKASNSRSFWTIVKELQTILRKEIQEGFIKPEFFRTGRGDKPKIIRTLQWRGELRITLIHRSPSPFKLRLFFDPLTGDYKDFFLLRLFPLLEGLPSPTFRLCPVCKKFFINPSMKEKHFCSPKCMWRSNAQTRRDELKKDPKKYQAYLEKQREIMNKRYEEKQKALGYKKVSHHKKREKKEN